MFFEALRELERNIPELIVQPAPGEPEDEPAAIEVVVGRHKKTFNVPEKLAEPQPNSIFLARHQLRRVLGFMQPDSFLAHLQRWKP